nr:retrovirus-related Pol polyprotein from transposon TNT 1-94 [Tanacetum cinerariifolium]
DVILQECVSNDVKCSNLQSLSDLDALAELKCMSLHKVKECDCLAQKLSKQTESVSKEVHNELLKRFAKVEKHSISLEIALQKRKEQVKNDTLWNEKASNVFKKEHEQYIKIQDLKAQLQDKNIAISELKKLIEKGKGKSVDTKFDKPYVVRQPNAQRIPKPSVLGTAQTSPQTAKQAVSKTNVLKPGMYRIDNRSTQTRAPQLLQTIGNTNPRVSTSTGVNHKPNVSRPQLKSDQSRDKVLPNNSQVKVKKTQLEVRPRILSVSNKMMFVTVCKDSLNSRTLNANAVCATCNKCLVDSNHFACVTKILNEVNARTKKPNFAQILGYGDLVQGNVTINKGNDLLNGNHGSDLYTISLQESTSSTPLCLMAKASLTQAWLWHRRLSHLNFDYINLLSKKDIVIGLPKLKYVKDQLCSSCELSKAKRSLFKSKAILSSKGRLNLLHMDLCGPIGTGFLNKTLKAFFKEEGTEHQTSTARTPKQNGIVERWNRTLVKAARMLLSASKVPLFFWAEAIATTCYTQNRSIIIPTHGKTSYHIINDRKPSIKHLYIFGCICYITRDGENLDKMKEKGDQCILVGYSAQSKGYHVYNKRTSMIVESIHIRFDEIKEVSETGFAESSSHNIGNSNVPTFNQPQVSEYRWTKDHPLKQVRGNPSRPVQIRRQLAIDPEMCMYTLTMSTTEPKSIKEAMADSTWIEAMQEELHQFDRLQDKTPEVLKNFLMMTQRNLQALVITIRTDRGTEFLNKTLKAFFKEEGIEHQTSTARTPEQNGIVERWNRTLVEAARTMLSALKVPLFFWAEAIATTCYTQNRSIIIPTHGKTPYHIINDRKPSIKHLHIFGCICYITRDGENLDKMKEKGDQCSNPQGKQPSTNMPSTSTPSNPTYIHAEENNNDQAEEGEQLQDDEFTNPFCTLIQEVAESSSHNIGNSNVPTFNQPQVFEYRWTKDHQLKQEAMADSTWIEAMQEELHQFDRLQDEDQTVIHNKARLVAKGTQVFSNLSDGRENGISNGSLKEEVYVAQPDGFVDPDHPEKVYRLRKALYGLNRFEMSLMGEMKFFLGLKIHQSPCGIFINQAKYTLKILHKHGMDKGESIGTPMATKPKLDVDLSGNPVDQMDYRSKIGSLMYLTSSRLDIVQAGSSFELTAFSDADHAGCINSRESTSGGIQFLGDKEAELHNNVSWMSKKQNCTAITEYQLADMFTKALPEDRFKILVRRIGMRCLTPTELEVLAKESA